MLNFSKIQNLKKIENIKSRIFIFGAVFLISLIIIFSRRPDAVLNPQFWAEDGKIWYAMAYNNGILTSLFATESSYYQTISRLVAGFSILFPLKYAPLIFNLSAIFTKILIVKFIISERFSKLIPSISVRYLLAFFFLALPNSFEVHANLTNVQWHLALLVFLVLIANHVESKFWKIFDVTILIISALSGPFCLFLFPLSLICWLKTREKRVMYAALILFFGCVIQGIAIFSIERITKVPLGVEVGTFIKIIGGKVFFSSIFGGKFYSEIFHLSDWNLVITLSANIIGFVFLIYALWKSPFELKLFICFSALICLGALASPAVSETEPQWQALAKPYAGARYWFIPVFCILTTLVYFSSTARNKFFRYAAQVFLLFSFIGIAADWKYPRFTDYQFQKYAAEFENAPSGETFVIPINPNWEMKLTKK